MVRRQQPVTMLHLGPERGIAGLAGCGFRALPRSGIDVDPERATLDTQLRRTFLAAGGPALRLGLEAVVNMQDKQVGPERFAQVDQRV